MGSAGCLQQRLGCLSWYLKTGAVNSHAGMAALFWGARWDAQVHFGRGTSTLCSLCRSVVCVQAFGSSLCGFSPVRTAAHNLRCVSLECVGRTVLMVL